MSMFTKNQALVLLVQQIFDLVDEVASLEKQGYGAQLSKYMLKEVCDILHDLTPEDLAKYHDILVSLGEKRASPGLNSYHPEWSSMTEGSKRKLIEKLKVSLAA